MDRFDVLIVGAGPAGSFAAERLARGGVRVALFDGRPPGEPKACGGGVTSKALKAWPHLLDAVGRTIDELDMYSPSGKHLHLKLDEPFAVYSRNAFDTFLLERARAAGAKVFAEKISGRGFRQNENGWIVCAQTGAEFFTDWLVGADGANSAIAKKLAGPLPPAEMGIAFGYRGPLPDEGDTSTVIAFLPNWPGYAWAFPRVDHVSFGIAISLMDFKPRPLDALLWDFMVGYYCVSSNKTAPLWSFGSVADPRRRKIGERLETSVEKYAARVPQLSPTTWKTRKTAGVDWALVGDAAGFVDPITDEGIYYALRSAELLAEAYLEGKPLDYESRWRADFGLELQRAATIRRRFYGNLLGLTFAECMINLAYARKGIRRTLADLIGGDQHYVGLKRSLARSLLHL